MKILLVDDHKMMRDGLRAILEKANLTVVGEAATGREALALARELAPDIVVMDISMPDLNGIDATRRLTAELPKIKVIGLSMNLDRRYFVAMFEAGAAGYMVKNGAADELIQAIGVVAGGLKYVSPSIAALIVEGIVGREAPAPAAPVKTLTAREREVLQLLAEGKSSKDIASELSIAVSTVETHRRQITDKLKLHTVAELTKYAIREGLTTLE